MKFTNDGRKLFHAPAAIDTVDDGDLANLEDPSLSGSFGGAERRVFKFVDCTPAAAEATVAASTPDDSVRRANSRHALCASALCSLQVHYKLG